jgi:2-dehydropantoate 2-reductase
VKGIKGSQKGVLAGRRINYEDWHILWDGEGSLRIGPLAIIEGSETRESEARRQRTPRYLIETLRSCRALNAHKIDAATITFERCKALAVEAILGPVSALLECTYLEIEAGIMDDPSTRELVKRLFTETWEVFNRDIQSIQKEKLLKWLSVKMSRDADMSSTMVQRMLMGRCSELDWINGWIVKRGKQHGIACDTHQGLMDIIKRKIDQKALEISRNTMIG